MIDPAVALLFGPREGADATLVFMIQIALIFAIFYWLLIRPQRKERERHQQMVESLKKGDEIVTSGGIIGTVVHAQPDRLTIRTGENTRLVVERQKVARKVEATEEQEQPAGAAGGKAKRGR